MTPVMSFNRKLQKSSRDIKHSPATQYVSQVNCFGICICLVTTLPCWTAICFAGGSGSGIGIKVGAQTLNNPFDLDETTRARYELELTSSRFWNDYFDMALIFGGSSLGSYHDEFAGYDDDVLIEEFYSDHYSLFDIRLAGRLYPLGNDSRIKPYMGAGVGYFWFLDSWEYEYYETYEDPLSPGVFHTYVETGDGSDTLANGLFPFVMAGLMVPVAPNFELQFEVQYHYDKQDSGFDFGGPVYMFGFHSRF